MKSFQKIDLLAKKYYTLSQSIPTAEQTLNTYKNASVTTAEAQEELTKKIISCYNEDYKQTIYNIQNAFDDKYLKLYIQGLKYIQENGIITFEQYYEFIKPYFLFDL